MLKLNLNDSKYILSANNISVLGYEISDGLVRPDKWRLQSLLDLEIPTKKTSLKRFLGMFANYAKWIPQFSDCIQVLIKAKQFSEEMSLFLAWKCNIRVCVRLLCLRCCFLAIF